MIRRFLVFSILNCGVAFSAHAHFIGNEGGNGGDVADRQAGSAWFTANKPFSRVTFCVEMADDFKIKLLGNKISPKSHRDDAARSLIYHAIQIWGFYAQDRDIHIAVGGERFYLATSPSEVSCSAKPDLKFYLGRSDELVESLRAKYRAPVGFAHQTSFDPNSGRGTGLIWIDHRLKARGGERDWDEDSFTAILIHELGHANGCQHVSGTVMDADIADKLFQPRYGLSIDEERMLTSNRNRGFQRLFGRHDWSGHVPQNSGSDLGLITVLGHLPKFPIFTTISEGSDHRSFSLRYSESLSPTESQNHDFQIRLESTGIEASTEVRVFKFTVKNETKSYPGGQGVLYFGKLMGPNGTYPIVLQENGPDRRVSISLIQDGQHIPIH